MTIITGYWPSDYCYMFCTVVCVVFQVSYSAVSVVAVPTPNSLVYSAKANTQQALQIMLTSLSLYMHMQFVYSHKYKYLDLPLNTVQEHTNRVSYHYHYHNHSFSALSLLPIVPQPFQKCGTVHSKVTLA